VSAAGVALLSSLPQDELASRLRECCGSDRWVDAVAARSPFADEAALLAAADEAFASLEPQDWQQALQAIAEPGVAADADAGTRAAAELGLRLYRERFGQPFVIATERMTAEELLMRIRIRLANDAEAELRAAGDELRRLSRSALERLLERGAGRA
jgi:2-oxo-4-hydroxy-4-carboxy-5-ureidoimidazoline decarboxylase